MTRKLITSITLTIAFAAGLSACSNMGNGMSAKPTPTEQNPAHQMHYSDK